jgi:hypothetical protein
LTSIQAQTIELTPIYGYQFGTKLEFGSSYLKIADSDEYGLSVGYEVDYGLYLEAAWIHNSTELLVRDRVFSPNEQRLSDLSADWAQLGAVKYFKVDNVRPYFGGGAGLVFLSTKDENRDLISRDLDNDTKFFFAFKGGVQIMFTDLIGLNLQGNLRFPVDWGGFYVGVGSAGASSGVALESTTVVGGFSAGLVFKLNGSDE